MKPSIFMPGPAIVFYIKFKILLVTAVKLSQAMRCAYTDVENIDVILFTCVALAKAGLVVGPLRPSGRPQHFKVPSLCNL